MLSGAALRIVKRAITLRVANGEDVETVVHHYTKLSDEQMQAIITELTSDEAEKVGVSTPAASDKSDTVKEA